MYLWVHFLGVVRGERFARRGDTFPSSFVWQAEKISSRSRLFFTPQSWYKQVKKRYVSLLYGIPGSFSKYMRKFQTMNHFSKNRYSQQLARGQALLLETSPLPQESLPGGDRLYRQASREIMPLPANGQQLLRWIEELPREVLDSHPRIGLLYIHALLLTQQYERARRYLKLTRYALRYWQSSEKASIEAEIETLHTYLRMHQELTSRYREAINGLAHFMLLINAEKGKFPSSQLSNGDPATELDPLSKRELEVLSCIAAGMSNQEIAQKIVVAVGTVKRHINNIYNKLDVHSRIQAVRYAQNHNLLPV